VSTVAQLPQGNTALLRDPDEVPERLRRPALAKQAEMFSDPAFKVLADRQQAGDDVPEIEFMPWAVGLSELNDLAVVAFVADWSFTVDGSSGGEKLRVTVDNLLDLRGDCYAALQKAAAPLWTQMMKTADDMTPDGVTDPASPTGP
jgi:hypothetical protein